MAAADRPQVHLERREDWRAWLAEHHASGDGVWLVSWKQATGRPAVGYDAAVEEALCFGWIDSLARSLDEERIMLLFTPRKRGSGWSRLNKERVARLEAAGLIEPAGAEVIETARADGSWSALDDVENLVVPDDLAAAFAARSGAAAHWERFPRSVKRGILAWILDAKRPATRARRIEEVATEAAGGRRPRQWQN
jgi:uncharacterized protein YdeI (YjbR/CyaY-like superfamily)